MSRLSKSITIYNLFLLFLILLNILPVLAPVLLHLGFENASGAIYDLYSLFCHQQHWKTIHIFDNQFAWCARDTFIWFSLLVTAIFVKKTNYKAINWKIFVIYMIPIGLDGGMQTIASIVGFNSGDAFYISTNLLRMLTGTIFGVGLGLFLMPTLRDVSGDGVGEKVLTLNSQLKYLGVIIIVNFFIYILIIQIWKFTSTSYLPSNFLDSEVKLPDSSNEWFDRRENGNSFVKEVFYN